MPDITVYTVIIGNYDNLRPPGIIEPGVRYVCVTDQPLQCEPWEIMPAFMPYESASRNSRIPKILAHLHFNSEYTIYHDGQYKLMAKPSQLIDENLKAADIAFYRHPCRKSVYQEMETCRKEDIGYGDAMIKQVENYRRCGLGDGLWAGSFIARRSTYAVEIFNERWWSEYIGGCMRDQISLPMAQRITGIPIHTINAYILDDTERIKFCWHADFNQGDNPSFLEARRDREKRRKRLRELCPKS